MKAKKYIIIFTGILIIVSIIFFVFLQFRLYHWFGIYGNGKHFLSTSRDFCLIITSGIFTSSFVSFIISIREYLDEKETALRNLSRLASLIKEKLKNIKYFVSEIPEDLAIAYFSSKDRYEKKYKQDAEFFKENNIDVKKLKYIQEKEENEKRFRECIWNGQPDFIKKIYNTEKARESFLDKELPNIESDYIVNVNRFIKSLHVFDNFNIYEVQESFDKLDFLFNNKSKNNLSDILLPTLATSIELVKYYRNLTLDREGLFSNHLIALKGINCNFLTFTESRKNAYLKPVYHIDCGKLLIDKILSPRKKDTIPPDIKNYSAMFPNMDLAEEILFDAWRL